jgi:excisionase family DNA binding protein
VITIDHGIQPERECEYLSPKEVALTLRVSERTVYNWVRSGELPAKQIGRTWRIKYQDLDRK